MIGRLKLLFKCGEHALNQRYNICLLSLIAISLFSGNRPLFSAPVISKEHVKQLGGPEGFINFEAKHLDFGKKFRGQSIDLSFVFKNIGEGPLMIRGIHSMCGCVVAKGIGNKIYEPGQTGSIDVSIDTTRFEGDFRKTIAVLTNQSKRNSYELSITGYLQSELTVNPPIVNFDANTDTMASAADHQEQLVKITSADSKTFSISGVEFEDKLFDVSYQRDLNSQDWIVSIKPKTASQSVAIKSSITINNNSKHLSRLIVPIHLHPSPSVESKPDYVEFGALSMRKESKKIIALTGKKPFNIIGQKAKLLVNGKLIENPERYLSVTVKNTSNEHKKDLEVKLLQGDEAIRGSVHGRFLFELDHPQQDHVSVDFYAHFGG